MIEMDLENGLILEYVVCRTAQGNTREIKNNLSSSFSSKDFPEYVDSSIVYFIVVFKEVLYVRVHISNEPF